jgi:hypothetical protein
MTVSSVDEHGYLRIEPKPDWVARGVMTEEERVRCDRLIEFSKNAPGCQMTPGNEDFMHGIILRMDLWEQKHGQSGPGTNQSRLND